MRRSDEILTFLFSLFMGTMSDAFPFHECVVPRIQNAQFTLRGGLIGEGAYVLSGMELNLSCNNESSVQGATSSTCQETGDWMPAFGTCHTGSTLPTNCGSPPDVQNGRVLPGSSSTGYARFILCDETYILDGPRVIKCLGNGTWTSSGRCRRNSTETTTSPSPSPSPSPAPSLNTTTFGTTLRAPPCRGFQCNNGRCTKGINKCDRNNNCGDYSDESLCPHTRPDLIGQNDIFAQLIANSSSAPIEIENFIKAKRIDLNRHDLFIQTFCNYYLPNATFLVIASACNRSAGVVKVLLDKGLTDVDRRPLNWEKGNNALVWAAISDNLPTIRLLLSRGANVNVGNLRGGATALHLAAYNGHYEAIQELVKAQGVDLNVRDSDGKTPLVDAASRNYVRIVKLLVNLGADQSGCFNYYCPRGFRGVPLYGILAVMDRNMTMLQAQVLRNPGIVHQRGICCKSQGATPLICTACTGDVEMARFLLDNGANIDVHDSDDLSPLHVAARSGHPDVIGVFLDHGADIDESDGNDFTALMIAASNGFLDVVKLLVSRGANRFLIQRQGFTALDIARILDKTDVEDYLASA